MYNILTLNKISSNGLDLLPKDKFNIADKEQNPDAILLRSASMHEMELPASLKAIGRAGAGVNNIPVEDCAKAGIVVFNTPGANANAVKELVIAGLLLSSRKIIDGVNWANSLKGQKDVAKLIEKGKSEFVGPEIAGKKMGVIGLGAIGVLVSNVCKSLGMEVFGYDPYLSVDKAWSLSRAVSKASSFEEICKECDYISVHIPLNEKTKGVFNKELFAKMKDGIRILNFSRGELVNNPDMKDALESGKVGAYVTDFPTEETLEFKNVISVPHLGASTPESEDNCAVMAAEQVRDFLENGNIKNSVNFPDCELPTYKKSCVCIIHENIPSVVGPVTGIFAEKKINIDNMINKSKGNFAYTMVAVDAILDDTIGDTVKAIEGVISVRIITK